MIEEDKQYKVFGRRKGKYLSNLQKKNLNNYINNFSIFKKNDDGIFDLKKINPVDLFNGIREVRLEIGFGMGDFLFEEALANPNVGFIGCEVFENGVASLLAKIIKFKITNIRIHFGNCLDLVHNLNNLTLSKIYILFPDPWPKTKHKKRRFFNEKNAIHLCSKLKRNGTISIATDIEDYANQILVIMQEKSNFDNIESNFFQTGNIIKQNFNTKYEEKALKFGRKINYIILKKKYD